jgi:hypothetical protein
MRVVLLEAAEADALEEFSGVRDITPPSVRAYL